MKDKIYEIIKKYMIGKTGALSVGWSNPDSGESFYYSPDMIMPSASTYKIFILADLIRGIYEKQWNWNDHILLTQQDKSVGSGVLSYLTGGLSLPLWDYACLMMMISDNTAADVLFKLCGKESIQEHILKPYELSRTKCGMTCREMITHYYQCIPHEEELSPAYFKRCIKDLNRTPYFLGMMDNNNVTTAKDMTSFLIKLYQGKIINAQVSQSILSIMKLCQTNTRIPKYLPSDVSIAHKTGTMDRVANDAGIIYTSDGNYVLSIFYNGNAASSDEYVKNNKGVMGDQLLADLSCAVYHAWMTEHAG